MVKQQYLLGIRMMRTIPIACDHAGFELKEKLKKYLQKKFDIKDFGAYSTDSVDYCDTGLALSKEVAKSKFERGILICGSGIGMSIIANKVDGIRATLCHSVELAKLARMHNNSNILVLAGRFLQIEEAKDIVNSWLVTDFQGGRHQKRLDKITNYEIARFKE